MFLLHRLTRRAFATSSRMYICATTRFLSLKASPNASHASSPELNAANTDPTIQDEYVSLEIRDPTALLRAISGTYENTTRILVEYVDNAIDAAEAWYQPIEYPQPASADQSNQPPYSGTYATPLAIYVDIDLARRNVWIRDTASGIPREELVDLIRRVGDSKKKGVSFLNGQFGFGMQCFRAMAESMTVYSTTQGQEGVSQLSVRRDESHMLPPQLLDTLNDPVVMDAMDRGIFRTSGGQLLAGDDLNAGSTLEAHGTSILLSQVDPVWFQSLSARTVADELQSHFESLLSRDNLRILVTQTVNKQSKRRSRKVDQTCACARIDYSKLDGVHFRRNVGGLNCNIVVSKTVVPRKRVRFFKNGRCVNYASELKSFLKQSRGGAQLWEHPSVCGLIEVGDTLTPVLTRNEFIREKQREAAYSTLHGLEEELQDALRGVLREQTDDRMVALEKLLRGVVRTVTRRATEEARGEVETEEGAVAQGNLSAVDKELEKGEENEEEGPLPDKRLEVEGVPYQTLPLRNKDNKDNQDFAGQGEGEVVKKDSPKKKIGMFDVRFVYNENETDGAEGVQSFYSDGSVYINTAHREFTERSELDSKGRPKFGPRLAAYLSLELAQYYQIEYFRKNPHEDTLNKQELFNRVVATANSVEKTLNSRMKTLQKAFTTPQGRIIVSQGSSQEEL